jgi:hypothetical protein
MKAATLTVAIVVVATALFVESLRVIGLQQIGAGLARVGWGFAAVIVLSGVRDVVRAIAWAAAVEPPAALPFRSAFRARLAGEALNTLLPMGIVVGEPVKASEVGERVPFGVAARALAVEFAVYGVSLIPLFAAGAAAVATLTPLGIGPLTLLAAGGSILVVAAAIVGRLIRKPLIWRSASLRTLITIAACECAYQILAVVEVYVTLRLISPETATVASALVLEITNRAVTIFFKMVPMRVGVDEASSSFVAAHVHLDPATGLTLALVRKLRLAFWSAAGLALLAWRRVRAVRPQRVVSASLAALLLLILARGA